MVGRKLIPIKSLIEGQRILFCEDSIVRGTQLKDNVQILYDYGAKEVHMRISSPPIKHPCYFGIDTATHDQLIGENNSVDEICKLIGADSLNYLSIEDLLKTVEGAACNFCVGCFSGKYPENVDHLIKCRTKNVLD